MRALRVGRARGAVVGLFDANGLGAARGGSAGDRVGAGLVLLTVDVAMLTGSAMEPDDAELVGRGARASALNRLRNAATAGRRPSGANTAKPAAHLAVDVPAAGCFFEP